MQKAAEDAPNDPLALEAYAEFLAYHRDPAARAARTKSCCSFTARNGASPAERAKVARRLVELDLMAGDRASCRNPSRKRSAPSGGSGLVLPPAVDGHAPSSFIEIPGPLRSFARMSAISPDIAPDDVMPALAHNVTLNGYAAGARR